MKLLSMGWLLSIGGCVLACSGTSTTGNKTTGGGSALSSGGSSSTPAGGAAALGGSATEIQSSTAGSVSTGGVAAQAGGNKSTGGVAAQTGGSKSTGGANNGGSSSVTLSPGCGITGSATDVQNLTIQVAGQDRSYVLFVPKTYAASTPLPLIFAWHGLGGTGTMARQYFGIERAANNQAILVYPTGLTNSDGKTAWTLTQTGVDVQLFDALLTDIGNKYCIDTKRVYSTGHSYGAMMTNALGCYRGNVLRGIAPVAGMPPFGNPTCTGAVAAWIAHGENDGTVDFTTGGIASRDLWIKLDGCSATTDPVAVDPSPCVAYQGCSNGHPVHWCVHQDDHNWPNFAGAGIWGFFDALK